MERSYFFTQVISLLHVPIYFYQEKIEVIGDSTKYWNIWERDNVLLEKAVLSGSRDYPVVSDVDDTLVYGVIRLESGETLLLGPVMTGGILQEQKLHFEEKYKFKFEKAERLSICQLDRFVWGLLLIYSFVSGKELSVTELWDKNKAAYKKTMDLKKRMSQDMFWQQEHVTLHTSYEQELKEIESIESGDVGALKKMDINFYKGYIDVPKKDVLRVCKDAIIGNIVLASRAAIRGGVSVEQSLSMADSLVQQVEAINSILEMEVFKREVQYAFASAVEEEKRMERQKGEGNSLVQQVKEYVFRNLHSAIRVSDIAKNFHVNADYLSHLFSEEERMTLSRYILQEKIQRGKNLLKYSDYRIQEISFYLGFSSQSHFAKRFQEVVGMSPNTYRKKHGNLEKWR